MGQFSSSIEFETEYAKTIFDEFAETMALDLSRAPAFGQVTWTFQIYRGHIFRLTSEIQKNFKSYEARKKEELNAAETEAAHE